MTTEYALQNPPSRPPFVFSSIHSELYDACQKLHEEIKGNLCSISGRFNRLRTLWSSMDRQPESTEAGRFRHQMLSSFLQRAKQLIMELTQDEIWSSSSVPGYPEEQDLANTVTAKLRRWRTYMADLSLKVSQTETALMTLGIGMESLLGLEDQP
jgi:hypothetical protein